MPNSTSPTSHDHAFPGVFITNAALPRPVSVEESSTMLERGVELIEDYARREPWAFAGWAFGIGFVLGWRLKPW